MRYIDLFSDKNKSQVENEFLIDLKKQKNIHII